MLPAETHYQNTVDVIFPAYPAFLYTNPNLVKYLLLPLFEYQATGQYPNKWAVHDMGKLLLQSRPIGESSPLYRRIVPQGAGT